jgi:cyclopropane fatty-acyl-phospholipid synthase-like methyltransferase
MSRITFENYSHIASLPDVNNTEAAGRLVFQQEAERKILPDILVKLDLKATDTLLEIGCGPGNLLVPLSGFCAKAAGIDNQGAITRLKNRFAKDAQISCIPGNFLDMNLPATHFDKILIYSVLHYLSNRDEAINFIERALSILRPGGRMLLGDVPNISKKSRFVNSKTGQKVAKNWVEQMKEAGGYHPLEKIESDSQLITFDDALVLDLMAFIRGKGFETFLLPQPIDLPFGGTREDILVVAHD